MTSDDHRTNTFLEIQSKGIDNDDNDLVSTERGRVNFCFTVLSISLLKSEFYVNRFRLEMKESEIGQR